MSARSVQFKAGIWAAFDGMNPGFSVTIARTDVWDGASGGLPDLFGTGPIGGTKTLSTAGPPYYWSNYPERSGDYSGGQYPGTLLWSTAQPVTGALQLGFNHVNATGVPTPLKLLVAKANPSESPSVFWTSCLSVSDTTQHVVRLGRFVSDAHPFATIEPANRPLIQVGTSAAWGVTPLPAKNKTGQILAGSLVALDNVITGLIGLNVTGGSVNLGLAMLSPGAPPGTAEAPPTALMRSRRRGKLTSRSMTYELAKTSFNWDGDPNKPFGDADLYYWTSFVGPGSPAGESFEPPTPNETWAPITKWSMNSGDDELWGDYQIEVNCGALTFSNASPQFNVGVVVAVVPLDDVGKGWADPGSVFRSAVFLKYGPLAPFQPGFPYQTVPFDHQIPNQAGWSAPLNTNLPKTTRKVIILHKMQLQGANASGSIPSFTYQICNGSAGWFAFVVLATRLAASET